MKVRKFIAEISTVRCDLLSFLRSLDPPNDSDEDILDEGKGKGHESQDAKTLKKLTKVCRWPHAFPTTSPVPRRQLSHRALSLPDACVLADMGHPPFLFRRSLPFRRWALGEVQKWKRGDWDSYPLGLRGAARIKFKKLWEGSSCLLAKCTPAFA